MNMRTRVVAAVLPPAGTRVVQTLSGSPFSVANNGRSPMTALVRGGTVSAVALSRLGGAFDDVGVVAGAFVLFPGGTLRVTYSVAPTVTTLT